MNDVKKQMADALKSVLCLLAGDRWGKADYMDSTVYADAAKVINEAQAALSAYEGQPMTVKETESLVNDIHDAIAEIAGRGRYPDLTDAIDQLAAQAMKVPSVGWMFVPEEPTKEMMAAAWWHAPLNMDDMTDGDFGQAYKDMLAAAPSAKD